MSRATRPHTTRTDLLAELDGAIDSADRETARADKAEAELAAACADLATLRRAAQAYRDISETYGVDADDPLYATVAAALDVALRGERREGEERRGNGGLGRRNMQAVRRKGIGRRLDGERDRRA